MNFMETGRERAGMDVIALCRWRTILRSIILFCRDKWQKRGISGSKTEEIIKYNGKEVVYVNFAVCDLSSRDSIKLKTDLSRIWPEVKIDVFRDCGRLLEQIRQGDRYELLFLDVFVLYMRMPDGSCAVDLIQKELPRSELVFTSVGRDYGPEAFERNALYYFVKPCSQKKLLEIKRRFRERHMPEVEVYDSRTRQTYKLPFQKIVYIESLRNYLYIHLAADDVVKVRGSLTDFMEKLDDRFLKINRGIIVNMAEIEQMSTDSCKINGLIFMLSRSSRAENRRKYYEYRFRNDPGGDEYR